MSFFDEDDCEFATTSVEGVMSASIIKMAKGHPAKGGAGFSIAAEMLERAKWTHDCDKEGKPACLGVYDFVPDASEPYSVIRRGCKNYHRLRFRLLPVGNKTIDGYDIASTWIRVLGMSDYRKFDCQAQKYVGAWKNSDWESLKAGDKKFRPVRNARIVLLGEKNVRLHANPIQIRIDGTFGGSFSKNFMRIRRSLISVARSMFCNASPNGTTDLRDDELLAHVPIKLVLESQLVGKAGNCSAACVVSNMHFISVHEGLVQPGSEESSLTIDQVRDAREWIVGLESQSLEDESEIDDSVMEPVKRRLESPEDGPSASRARNY